MTTIKVGDYVRHSLRGQGIVRNIAINPLTKRPSKVEVDFRHGIALQTTWCWPDDLTVLSMEPPPRVTPKPVLRAVEPVGPSAA